MKELKDFEIIVRGNKEKIDEVFVQYKIQIEDVESSPKQKKLEEKDNKKLFEVFSKIFLDIEKKENERVKK